MRKLLSLTLAALTVAAFSSPGLALDPYDVPVITCEDATGASITLKVCGGATTGAPAGLTIHWTTKEQFELTGWDDPICELSLSGQPSQQHPGKSRWELDAGECETIIIGDLNFDETGLDANGTCAEDPLVCGTTYVFRVFAHAGRGFGRSAFSDPVECSTDPCAEPGDPCTYTQGFWKTHGPAPCQKGNNTNEWPSDIQTGGMSLGTVPYDQDELCSILQEPAKGNGLVFLAHQLIAAKLNVANNAPDVPCQDLLNDIIAADALIGNLVVPPVGGGSLTPMQASALNDALTAFNEGERCGWLHCGDEEDPCEGGPAQTDWNLGQAPDPSTYDVSQNWALGTMRVDASGGIPNPWCSTQGGAGELCREGGQWPDGDALNCEREYILDLDATFQSYAMMAYDLGAAKRGFRLYTSIDHWNGNMQEFVDNAYITQDVMEYSVWGYTGPVDGSGVATAADLMNMAHWKLLSDVVGHDNSQGTIDTEGHPTYTFDGDDGAGAAAPVTVWIGGSAQCGQAGFNGHAFTRDYEFCDAYRYVGVRSSTISILATDGPGDRVDGDPELDAVFGYDPDGGGAPFARLEQPVDGSIRPQLRQGKVAMYGLTPNPFTGRTQLDYAISGSTTAHVQIDVFDVSGRLVRTLETGSMAPGRHSVIWNGRDAAGAHAGSGVYFIRVTVGGESVTSRVLLLK